MDIRFHYKKRRLHPPLLLHVNAMTLACEHGNVSLQTLNIYTSRYSITIEGAYSINTYNIGICKIGIL